jgi:CDP-glucose 4,6-dehydratase
VEDLVSGRDALKIYAGRRILVTGHTGFKGSWLSLWLQKLGAELTGYSDDIPTDPSHYLALGLDMADHRGDICDQSAISAVIAETRPELIFHFAAQSLVRKAYSDPFTTYHTNVLGTLSLLDAARRNGVGAVIIAATDKVYRNDESGRRYTERDELGGSDPYSASKSCVELLVRSFRESFVRDGSMLIATVRAGNVIGGGDWAQDRILPDLMRAAFEGHIAEVRNPASTRPWQHILDVLAGYLIIGGRLLAGNSSASGAWNLGPVSDTNIRVDDIVDAAKAQLPQLRVLTDGDTSGGHESVLLQLDSTKAISELGWRPLWEGEMLERTIAWYRAFYDDGLAISSEQLADYEAAWI